MKKFNFLFAACAVFLAASCGGGNEKAADGTSDNTDIKSMYPEETPAPSAADAAKGVGKFKDVTLSEALDVKKAETGKGVYDLKCSACHRLEGDRLVGPSWKGVTTRREPAWILNFITNVDEMLSKDPVAMAQLEECLVRMPNQNLSDDDAFAVLEYMRQLDGVK